MVCELPGQRTTTSLAIPSLLPSDLPKWSSKATNFSPIELMSLEEFGLKFDRYSNGEYYDLHRARFWEMINAIDFFRTKIGNDFSVLEFGSDYSTRLIIRAFRRLNLSTLDFVVRDELKGLVRESVLKSI